MNPNRYLTSLIFVLLAQTAFSGDPGDPFGSDSIPLDLLTIKSTPNKVPLHSPLIENGDFSSGLKGWVASAGQKSDIIGITLEKENDRSFLRMKIDGEPIHYVKALKTVTVQERSLYEITMRYRVQRVYNENNGRLSVECKTYDDANEIIHLDYPIADRGQGHQGQWKKAIFRIFCPENARTLTFACTSFAADVHVSEVQMVRLEQEPSRERDQLIRSLESSGNLFQSEEGEGVDAVLKKGTFALFTAPDAEFISARSHLAGKKILKHLRQFGARNEVLSFPIHIAATQPIKIESVICSDLKGAGLIQSDQILVRKVKFIRKHKFYVFKSAKTVIPSPLEDFSPINMEAESLATVWLTVKIPSDARPGDHAGALSMVINGSPVRVPLTIRIFNLSLPEAASKYLGTWYPLRLGSHHASLTDEDYIRSFHDMKAHGNNAVVIDPPVKFSRINGNLRIDTERLAFFLNAVKSSGMKGPVVLRTRLTDLVALIGDYQKPLSSGETNAAFLIGNREYEDSVKQYFESI